MRIILSIVIVACTGCIGVFRGSTQGVWLLSNPTGANVTLDGQEGVTPCLKALDRDSRSVVVKYELAGHAPIEKVIEPRCDAGLLVTEVFLTILGCIVDSASGNAYSWPLGIQAQLAPTGGASTITETWALPKTPEQIVREQQEAAQMADERQGNRYTTQ